MLLALRVAVDLATRWSTGGPVFSADLEPRLREVALLLVVWLALEQTLGTAVW